MGDRIIHKALLGGLLLLLIASCAPARYPTSQEMLNTMKIDQTTYQDMTPCQQVRLYADVGRQYLDIGHSAAIVPTWMDTALAKQPPQLVADCIAEEGLYRLNFLAAQPAGRTEISYAVLALIFKAVELDLLGNPRVQELLNVAVCYADLDSSSQLVRYYYLSRFGKFPAYLLQEGDIDRMRNELCHNSSQ